MQVKKTFLKQSKLKDIYAITESFVCAVYINYANELIQREKITRYPDSRAL